jgi:hypothetical protein
MNQPPQELHLDVRRRRAVRQPVLSCIAQSWWLFRAVGGDDSAVADRAPCEQRGRRAAVLDIACQLPARRLSGTAEIWPLNETPRTR